MTAKKTKRKAPAGTGRPELQRLSMLLDVPLRLSVELGGTRLLINDLLRLSPGSVVELDRLAGEPLEIKVGGKLIARGEAVVVNGQLGVRVTEIAANIQDVTAGELEGLSGEYEDVG